MTRHRFHGDPARFEVVARFIADRFQGARYVADVAGGQGMLTRILRKRFGFEAEVVDPRGWALKGVPARAELYTPAMADYYDLVVGLHPTRLCGASSNLRQPWPCWSCRAAISGPAIVVLGVMS